MPDLHNALDYFLRVSANDFKITKFIWALLAVQIFGAIAAYIAIYPFSPDIAQGAFICIFCPTATAAPVITGMLGGSVPRLVTYSIFSNVAVALLAPALFTLMGTGGDIRFLDSVMTICTKVFPLILAPLALALLFQAFAPPRPPRDSQPPVSVILHLGGSIDYSGRKCCKLYNEGTRRQDPEMLLIAFAALIACCLQFLVGRRIGARLGDKISGAQGLGQKNTVLAIWMALTYLNPIASVGPAAYVAWQNTINSLQLFYKTKRDKKQSH